VERRSPMKVKSDIKAGVDPSERPVDPSEGQ
jgi:hypothetical protein